MKNIMRKSVLVAVLFSAAAISSAQVEPKKPIKPASTTPINVTSADDAGSKSIKGNSFRMPEGGGVSGIWSVPSGELKFSELPYGYDALEPVVDKLTVEIHYDRHHRAYFNNFQKAISETELTKLPIYTIFAKSGLFSEAVRNNAGGYFNHVLYWENLSPAGGGKPTGKLEKMIEKQFGSFDDFIKKFNEAAKSRFGSGWAWLSVDYVTAELFISSTPNQDNPMMDVSERKGVPILAMDVWEHAYYLQYQNKRAEYIDVFWKKVDWNMVEKRYDIAMAGITSQQNK
jgi:Fe-Mn family superoxide dismutase